VTRARRWHIRLRVDRLWYHTADRETRAQGREGLRRRGSWPHRRAHDTGKNFTGGPKITGPRGTSATVLRATSTRLTVRVKESASLRKGTYTLTVRFASGKRTSIHYTVR